MGLFQGGWILFDYIENIHLEYFSRELFQGSNVGWINIFFMEEGYCVNTYEIITMNDYFKEDVHLLISLKLYSLRVFQWSIISRSNTE